MSRILAVICVTVALMLTAPSWTGGQDPTSEDGYRLPNNLWVLSLQIASYPLAVTKHIDVKVPCACLIRLTSHFFAHCFLKSSTVLPYFGFSQYLALAPKLVRVDQTYNVYVTLYSFPYTSLRVRAVLSRNSVEYASSIVLYTAAGTKELQLRVSVCVNDVAKRVFP